jgi:CcmD family protein
MICEDVMKKLFTATCALLATGATAVLAAQPQPGGDFVPASSLPRTEALPAAPMVMAAYAVVWAVLLAYVWFIWRKLQKVEGEIAELERRTHQRQES